MNKKFLVVSGFLYLLATILGIIHTVNSDFSAISWAFVPMGIFIWGDALILGPFIISGIIWLWFKDKSTWTGLFFSTYLTVRSFIEIIYSLNAQFTDSVRPWEMSWMSLGIVKSFGRAEIFVLYQLLFTCVFIINSLVFIYFLRKYLK